LFNGWFVHYGYYTWKFTIQESEAEASIGTDLPHKFSDGGIKGMSKRNEASYERFITGPIPRFDDIVHGVSENETKEILR
jgi:hypothetical protein